MKAYWEGDYVVWLDEGEKPHEYMRELTSTEMDAERWRWLRKQEGWPDSEAAMLGAKPEEFDKMADVGMRDA